MPSQPIPPPPPVLPPSPMARRRLEQLAAAHGDGSRRAALARAPWLPAAAAEALALVDDPGFQRMAAGFRALEARRGTAPPPEPPRALRALLGSLAGRYPLAFATLRAGLAEERGPDGNNVITLVVVPSLVFYVVLVPASGWQQQGRCFQEALARLGPTTG